MCTIAVSLTTIRRQIKPRELNFDSLVKYNCFIIILFYNHVLYLRGLVLKGFKKMLMLLRCGNIVSTVRSTGKVWDLSCFKWHLEPLTFKSIAKRKGVLLGWYPLIFIFLPSSAWDEIQSITLFFCLSKSAINLCLGTSSGFGMISIPNISQIASVIILSRRLSKCLYFL